MRVLGIDPGLATVGFGVADAVGGRPVHVRHGAIKTAAGLPLAQRLLTIAEDLAELIDAFKPQEMAIEELFFNKNVTTGIAVAHGRGVVLMTAARYGLHVCEYTPQHVKMAVTGYGNAEKAQVMELTRQLLGLPARPRPDDAADALAVAITHAHTGAAASLFRIK